MKKMSLAVVSILLYWSSKSISAESAIFSADRSQVTSKDNIVSAVVCFIERKNDFGAIQNTCTFGDPCPTIQVNKSLNVVMFNYEGPVGDIGHCENVDLRGASMKTFTVGIGAISCVREFEKRTINGNPCKVPLESKAYFDPSAMTSPVIRSIVTE